MSPPGVAETTKVLARRAGAAVATAERPFTGSPTSRWRNAGFSLEEIAEQLAMLPNIHPVPPTVWAPLRKKWERRIDQHIAELKQLKIDLRCCTRDASR